MKAARHLPKSSLWRRMLPADPASSPSALSPAQKRPRSSSTDNDALSPTKNSRLVNPFAVYDPSIPLKVKLLDPSAKVPVRGSAGAAGYDLCASKECIIPSKGKAIVPTGISIALPPGTYGRVAPRSGLAVKHFLDVGAGVVDADYRGPLGVVMFNFGDKDYNVQQGERIAQLILERCAIAEVVTVEDLDDTTRGSGGFGSTGKV